MPPSKQIRVIKVLMDDKTSKPAKKAAKQVGQLNKNVKKLTKSSKAMALGMSRPRTVFAGFIAAMGVRQMTRMIDTFQLLKDRITALWGETQNTAETFNKLAQVARQTNAPVATIADGFARLSVSTKDAGFSVRDTIKFTKALQQTLRLSGASIQEANSVFLQMSQAFGLGRLQGQELRAVMLGNAEAAKILAEIFDTTKGKLRDLGEKGLLKTDKIFQGFLKRTDELNIRAGLLKDTFGQTFVKIMDSFGLELDKLNTKFALTTKAAKAAKFLTDNIEFLFKAASALVISGILFKAAAGVNALYLSLAGTSLATVIGTGGVAAIIAGFVAIGVALSAYILKAEDAKALTRGLAEAQLELAEKTAERIRLENLSVRDIEFFFTGKKDKIKEALEEEKVATKALKNIQAQIKAAKILRELNSGNRKKELAEFEEVNKLYDKRNGITDEFIAKLREQESLKVEKQLKAHAISALAYEDALRRVNERFEKMRDELERIKLKAGGVFDGIKLGAMDVMSSIGTLAENVAGVTVKAFGHLENSLFEFTKKGKFEFRKFAEAILDDINRMIIRMAVIRPLAGAVAGSFGGTGAAGGGINTGGAGGEVGSTAIRGAKGLVLNQGNVIPFQRGGIVDRPTHFGMSGGRTGLMGEAGPEAILPLSRGPGGKLGVTGSGTTVNIINQSSDVETETNRSRGADGTEQIDVYIVKKVGEAFGDGRFDRPMQQLYGLNRKGN